MTEPVKRYHDAVAWFKRELLAQTLSAHGGNRSRAARALGLQRTYFIRLIRDFGVDVPRAADSRQDRRVE
jgi:DNA-binding NtrC family response regulator